MGGNSLPVFFSTAPQVLPVRRGKVLVMKRGLKRISTGPLPLDLPGYVRGRAGLSKLCAAIPGEFFSKDQDVKPCHAGLHLDHDRGKMVEYGSPGNVTQNNQTLGFFPQKAAVEVGGDFASESLESLFFKDLNIHSKTPPAVTKCLRDTIVCLEREPARLSS